MSKDQREAIAQHSWGRIATLVQSPSAMPIEPEEVRRLLRDFDPAWQTDELPMVVELSGIAYGELVNAAKVVAAARRQQASITEVIVDAVRIADDVLKVARELFALCESDSVALRPSLN